MAEQIGSDFGADAHISCYKILFAPHLTNL